LITAYQTWQTFFCYVPHVELTKFAGMFHTKVWKLSSVFKDSLSYLWHMSGYSSGWRSSRTLIIIGWHPSALETFNP
jgi:hypothetical protein